MSGTLEFVDTHDFTVMNTGEHFMATDVEWDPTGRYVATAVSWWGHKVGISFCLFIIQVIIFLYCVGRQCLLVVVLPRTNP